MNIDPIVALGLVAVIIGLLVIIFRQEMLLKRPADTHVWPEKTEIQLSDLELGDDDVLVYLIDQTLTVYQRAALREHIAQGLHNGLIVLEHGARFQVIKRRK